MSEPTVVDVQWRLDLYRQGETEPFHSDYHRDGQMLAISVQVAVQRADLERIEIVRMETVEARP